MAIHLCPRRLQVSATLCTTLVCSRTRYCSKRLSMVMKAGFVLRSTILACIRIKLSNKHLLIWKMLLCILKMIWVSVWLCLFEKLQGKFTSFICITECNVCFHILLAHCKVRSPLFLLTARYGQLYFGSL